MPNDNYCRTCWTEYYLDHGYDCYLFNYAGYGRSFGGNSWNDTSATEFSHGFIGALKRVLFSTFLAFKPSSESLKKDAADVARHLVDVVGVDELIIHGESIGGMAAAGAARALTATSAASKTSTILVCDRTFCNLEAVAQRLVGQWTGNAIRLLTPRWSTDVARDFLAAKCPKIVAQDCADEIIHDYSSLKSGLSFAGELTKGQTNTVGWMMSSPMEYRVADLDSVSVGKSRISASSRQVKNPPTWPADKHVSWSEAHHFAASVRRIGKLATSAKKKMQARLGEESSAEAEGIEVSLSTDESSSQLSPANIPNGLMQKKSEEKALTKLWKVLACCDGLCGHPLGHTVKEGADCSIAWLCCALIFGPQVLAEQAEKRWRKAGAGDDRSVFVSDDFVLHPSDDQWDDDDVPQHPIPMPVVSLCLKELSAQRNALQQGTFHLQRHTFLIESLLKLTPDKMTRNQSKQNWPTSSGC